MQIKLTGCRVGAIRADLLKNAVKVTFDAHLDEEMLSAKRLLAILAVDESPVDLVVTEQQMRLPVKGGGELTGAEKATALDGQIVLSNDAEFNHAFRGELNRRGIDAGEVFEEAARELRKQGIEATVHHAQARASDAMPLTMLGTMSPEEAAVARDEMEAQPGDEAPPF